MPEVRCLDLNYCERGLCVLSPPTAEITWELGNIGNIERRGRKQVERKTWHQTMRDWQKASIVDWGPAQEWPSATPAEESGLDLLS